MKYTTPEERRAWVAFMAAEIASGAMFTAVMAERAVELWPRGLEREKRQLASAEIWNDGTGSPRAGNYGFRLRGKGGRVAREGHLRGYKRVEFSAWWLLAACLRVAYPSVLKRTLRKVLP